MPKTLLYFPANWPLNASRRAYLEAAGYVPEPYRQEKLATADLLLLVTPVKDGEGNWISPEWVWKRYLEQAYPNLKPIQAGWHDQVEGKNYLNWFSLPPNFEAFVAAADLPKDWVPFDTMGERLEEVWRKFYDGHGKSGFQAWFIVADRRVGQALRAIARDTHSLADILDMIADEQTQQAFNNLPQRWSRYRLYFEADPRQAELAEMGTVIAQIEQTWVHERDDTDLQKWLEKLANLLQQLNNWKTQIYDTGFK